VNRGHETSHRTTEESRPKGPPISTSMLHHHPSQERVSPPTRSTTEAVSQSHNNLSHKRNTPRSQTPPNIFAAPVFPRSRQLATELLGLACFHEPNLFNSHVLQTTINDRRCMFLCVVAEIPNSVWFVVVVKRSVKRVWESGEMDARMACGMLHASCVS
jgi:hypothetical protein